VDSSVEGRGTAASMCTQTGAPLLMGADRRQWMSCSGGRKPIFSGNMSHFRTSVNGLLAVIAGACLALGAFRFHPSLGAFVLGVVCISWARLRQLEKAQAQSVVGTRARAKIVTIASTIALASVILLASLVAAVVVWGFLGIRRHSHQSLALEPFEFVIIALSSLAGIPASLLLRESVRMAKVAAGYLLTSCLPDADLYAWTVAADPAPAPVWQPDLESAGSYPRARDADRVRSGTKAPGEPRLPMRQLIS
jgi:hypothetical protein